MAKQMGAKRRAAELVKSIPRQRMEKVLRKSRLLTMRISEADHADLKLTASELGLTVTDYLLGIHRLVADRLKERSRK
jgi:hypothetical protein